MLRWAITAKIASDKHASELTLPSNTPQSKDIGLSRKRHPYRIKLFGTNDRLKGTYTGTVFQANRSQKLFRRPCRVRLGNERLSVFLQKKKAIAKHAAEVRWERRPSHEKGFTSFA